MGGLGGEIHHARKKRIIAELLKGKEVAIQLQTLLKKQSGKGGVAGGDFGLVQDLPLQILRSFGNSLAELSSCDSPAQIAAVDCGRRKKKPAGVRDRRGSYKRRTIDSRTTESSTVEDGFAWRKYGQKTILAFQYPRCYFRCTHKYEGCKALKQVQQIREKPTSLYQITYIHHHSCTKTSHLSLCPSDHLVEPKNLISFQSERDDHLDYPKNPTIPVKSEEHTDDQSVEALSDAKSSTLVQEDLAGLEHMPAMSSGQGEMGSSLQYSCDSTSLQYGMDISDQFEDDIDSLFSFDDIMH